MRQAVLGIVGACALLVMLRVACGNAEDPMTPAPSAARKEPKREARGPVELSSGSPASPPRIAPSPTTDTPDLPAVGDGSVAAYAIEVQVLDPAGSPIPIPTISDEPWRDVPALTARRVGEDRETVAWEEQYPPTTWRIRARLGQTYVVSSWDGIGVIASAKVQVTAAHPAPKVTLQLGPAESMGRLLLTPTVTGAGALRGTYELRIAEAGGPSMIAGQLTPNQVYSKKLPSGEYDCRLIDSAHASVPSTPVDFAVSIADQGWARRSVAMPTRGQLRIELIDPDRFGVELRIARPGAPHLGQDPLFGNTAAIEPGDWNLFVDDRSPIPFCVRAKETVKVTVLP